MTLQDRITAWLVLGFLGAMGTELVVQRVEVEAKRHLAAAVRAAASDPLLRFADDLTSVLLIGGGVQHDGPWFSITPDGRIEWTERAVTAFAELYREARRTGQIP